MRSPRNLAVLACAAALAAGAAACGDEDDGGERVARAGYELVVPDGWRDRSEDRDELGLAGLQPDVVLVGPRDAGVRPSVTVTHEAGLPAGRTLAAFVRIGRRQLAGGAPEAPGAELGPVRDARLAGEPAATFDHVRLRGGRRMHARQVVTLRGRSGYTVTYTALDVRFERDLPRFERLLASWRWR